MNNPQEDVMDIEFEGQHGVGGGVTLIDLKDQQGKGGDDLNLQMVLVNSSLNHEYMRKAYERTKSYSRKQELLVRMNQLKDLYFSTRQKLSECNPEALSSVEDELKLQKTVVFSDYSIH